MDPAFLVLSAIAAYLLVGVIHLYTERKWLRKDPSPVIGRVLVVLFWPLLYVD